MSVGKKWEADTGVLLQGFPDLAEHTMESNKKKTL
jgi:hypothetical protein